MGEKEMANLHVEEEEEATSHRRTGEMATYEDRRAKAYILIHI